jgi:hypothetical protein
MKRRSISIALMAALARGATGIFPAIALAQGDKPTPEANAAGFAKERLAAKFDYLSKNGNSSCSAAFTAAIASMPDDARLRGSCCSPMSLHRYGEQVEGLRKFKSAAGQDVSEIPDDPYNIEAGVAKKALLYYETKLSPQEQERYDYAMNNSKNKGPCCCRCWRWQVYGGLGKFVIRSNGFSGEQVAQLWNLSDGCGGEADHVEHS